MKRGPYEPRLAAHSQTQVNQLSDVSPELVIKASSLFSVGSIAQAW